MTDRVPGVVEGHLGHQVGIGERRRPEDRAAAGGERRIEMLATFEREPRTPAARPIGAQDLEPFLHVRRHHVDAEAAEVVGRGARAEGAREHLLPEAGGFRPEAGDREAQQQAHRPPRLLFGQEPRGRPEHGDRRHLEEIRAREALWAFRHQVTVR